MNRKSLVYSCMMLEIKKTEKKNAKSIKKQNSLHICSLFACDVGLIFQAMNILQINLFPFHGMYIMKANI